MRVRRVKYSEILFSIKGKRGGKDRARKSWNHEVGKTHELQKET